MRIPGRCNGFMRRPHRLSGSVTISVPIARAAGANAGYQGCNWRMKTTRQLTANPDIELGGWTLQTTIGLGLGE